MRYNKPFDQTNPAAPYVNGNPATNTAGSIPCAEGLEYPQREIVNAITAAGLTPANDDLTQLTQALGRGIWVDGLSGTGDLAVATLDVVLPSIPKGARIGGVANATNTTATPKLRVVNIGLAGATVDFQIIRPDGTALAAGDIVAGRIYRFEADGAGNVMVSGGGVSTGPRAQPLLQANTTYYVNAATGSDGNNGATAGTAFATLQAAVNTISKFNLNGFSVTVNVASGTYPFVVLAPVAGSGSVNFVGNPGAPANCIIQSTSGRNAISALGAGSAYTFSGFTLIAGGPSSNGDSVAGIVAVGSGTSVALSNMNFGVCAGGHMIAAQNAIIYLGGANTVSGGCAGSANGAGAHMAANALGNIFSSPASPPTINIVNSPSFAAPWAYAFNLALIQMIYGAAPTGSIGSAQRYSATGNSVITTAGGGANYFPGTTAGSTASGGQYI